MKHAAAPLLLLLTTIGGCATNPEAMGPNVHVYRNWPNCDYESLGKVEGQDGHQGHMSGQVWGPRGSDERALAELRQAAANRGADGVILLNRRVDEREAGRGSIQKRPGRVVHFTGMAIRDCR